MWAWLHSVATRVRRVWVPMPLVAPSPVTRLGGVAPQPDPDPTATGKPGDLSPAPAPWPHPTRHTAPASPYPTSAHYHATPGFPHPSATPGFPRPSATPGFAQPGGTSGFAQHGGAPGFAQHGETSGFGQAGGSSGFAQPGTSGFAQPSDAAASAMRGGGRAANRLGRIASALPLRSAAPHADATASAQDSLRARRWTQWIDEAPTPNDPPMPHAQDTWRVDNAPATPHATFTADRRMRVETAGHNADRTGHPAFDPSAASAGRTLHFASPGSPDNAMELAGRIHPNAGGEHNRASHHSDGADGTTMSRHANPAPSPALGTRHHAGHNANTASLPALGTHRSTDGTPTLGKDGTPTFRTDGTRTLAAHGRANGTPAFGTDATALGTRQGAEGTLVLPAHGRGGGASTLGTHRGGDGTQALAAHGHGEGTQAPGTRSGADGTQALGARSGMDGWQVLAASRGADGTQTLGARGQAEGVGKDDVALGARRRAKARRVEENALGAWDRGPGGRAGGGPAAGRGTLGLAGPDSDTARGGVTRHGAGWQGAETATHAGIGEHDDGNAWQIKAWSEPGTTHRGQGGDTASQSRIGERGHVGQFAWPDGATDGGAGAGHDNWPALPDSHPGAGTRLQGAQTVPTGTWWPSLLDDGELWAPPAARADEQRIARLDREQEGMPWNG